MMIIEATTKMHYIAQGDREELSDFDQLWSMYPRRFV